VVVERLNMAGMVRNKRLARAIADSGMGRVRSLLGYKCPWAGGRLVEAGTFFASIKDLLGLWDGESQAVFGRADLLLPGVRAGGGSRCTCGPQSRCAGRRDPTDRAGGRREWPGDPTNACVRDCQPTGDGGRSDSPDIGREAAGSQQSIRM
jgi:hypothetical protein